MREAHEAVSRDILRSMSSFYREYLPIGSAYEKLLEVYLNTFDLLWNEVVYYQSNIRLENAPTLKKIPYFKLDVRSGIYGKDIALKIRNLEFEEQLQYLNNIEAYVQLNFDEEGTRTPIVYNMQLKDAFRTEETLVFFDDYFLRDNRIYFMPKFILNLNKQITFMHAFNIRIDNMMLEKKWGYLFDVEAGNFLPRFQYRDVLSAFNRLMQSGLTIRDMKDAVQLATKWDKFDIQDIKSPNLTPARKRMYDDWLISPARFLVILHEGLIKDKIRLNILLSLLDESKEEQVTYLILFTIFREDYLRCDDEIVPTYLFFPKDPLDNQDKVRITRKFSHRDGFNVPHLYDIGRHYDYQLQYDWEGRQTQPVTMDEEGVMTDMSIPTDTPWFFSSDYFELRHVTFPKIPREMKVTRSGDDIIFEFNENKDGTKWYELFGVDQDKKSHFIKKVKFSKLDTNQIIHNATTDTMMYYKIRATANKDKSLFTLLINKETLEIGGV